jgi:hypothetical protein
MLFSRGCVARIMSIESCHQGERVVRIYIFPTAEMSYVRLTQPNPNGMMRL